MPASLEVLTTSNFEATVMHTSALLGYKKIFGFGLTLDISAGVTVLTSGIGDTSSYPPVANRLNAGIGWSF
jgi:hypothetical protein